MIYAVILAGGRGERFWPLSRVMSPKQFLNVTGSLTLIQSTIKRISKIIAPERIYVITNKLYAKEIRKQLSCIRIKSVNILLEPSSKDTAPAIAWVSQIIHRKDRDANLLILPSDHFIKNEKLFSKLIRLGNRLTEKNKIVTFGTSPLGAHEGYGYIKTKPKLPNEDYSEVDKFIEKPNLKIIEKFLKSKRYFWSCGIFMAKAGFLLDQFNKSSRSIYLNLKRISSNNLGRVWKKMPSISIDYALIEKIPTSNIVMVDATKIGWTDVGSWSELRRFLSKGKNNNIIRGDSIDIDSSNCIIWGKKRLIATLGLKDLIIIDTDDALLVCDINKCQNVRGIVKQIKKRGSHEHIIHKELKFIKPK